MPPMVRLVLLVFALVLFALDAWSNNAPPTRLTSAGLACLVASMITW